MADCRLGTRTWKRLGPAAMHSRILLMSSSPPSVWFATTRYRRIETTPLSPDPLSRITAPGRLKRKPSAAGLAPLVRFLAVLVSRAVDANRSLSLRVGLAYDKAGRPCSGRIGEIGVDCRLPAVFLAQ
jgi:hypothetical protein